MVNLIDRKAVWVGLATSTFDKPEQLESKILPPPRYSPSIRAAG
jgi:hypothetical protein